MSILRDELVNDPLGRGYAAMTNQQAADSLNAINRTRLRDTLSSAEIYEALDVTEFQSKTAAQQVYVRDVLGLGDNVRVGASSKARTVFVAVFGANSQTIANLLAVMTADLSRAAELGLPFVGPHHVAEARL